MSLESPTKANFGAFWAFVGVPYTKKKKMSHFLQNFNQIKSAKYIQTDFILSEREKSSSHLFLVLDGEHAIDSLG